MSDIHDNVCKNDDLTCITVLADIRLCLVEDFPNFPMVIEPANDKCCIFRNLISKRIDFEVVSKLKLKLS